MAYNSAHTGPEIDAAVQLLGEIQEARDSTGQDLIEVRDLAVQVKSDANQVSSQAETVAARAAQVASNAGAVEQARAEVVGATVIAEEAKDAAAQSATSAQESQISASVSEQAAAQSQLAAGMSEQVSAERAVEAASSAEQAASDRLAAAASAASAASSAQNAEAVVTGGTASVTPSPGLIPLADALGKIDADWLPEGIARTGAVQAAVDVAKEASDTATEVRSRTASFLLPAPEAPVFRDDGSPLQHGDRYFNTVDQAEYIYTSGGWEPNDSQQAIVGLADQNDPEKGAAGVGFDGAKLDELLLNAKSLPDYAALEAYTGRATGIIITGPGIYGHFYRDPSVTAGDRGTKFIDALGRGWRRRFEGPVHATWFGVLVDYDPDLGTGRLDESPFLSLAAKAAPGVNNLMGGTGLLALPRADFCQVYIPRGKTGYMRVETLVDVGNKDVQWIVDTGVRITGLGADKLNGQVVREGQRLTKKMPYGSIDTATCLSVSMGSLYADKSPAITGIGSTAALGRLQSVDACAFYAGINSTAALHSELSPCSYSQTSVTLPNPISEENKLRLRRGMFITTSHSPRFMGWLDSWSQDFLTLNVKNGWYQYDPVNGGSPSLPSSDAGLVISGMDRIWSMNSSVKLEAGGFAYQAIGHEISCYNEKDDSSSVVDTELNRLWGILVATGGGDSKYCQAGNIVKGNWRYGFIAQAGPQVGFYCENNVPVGFRYKGSGVGVSLIGSDGRENFSLQPFGNMIIGNNLTPGTRTHKYRVSGLGGTTDYDVMLSASGGAGIVGQGTYTVTALNLIVTGNVAPSGNGTRSLGTQSNQWSSVSAVSASFSGPIRPGQYTLSTLPSPAAWSGYEIDVIDASGGSKRCRSNGLNWHILNTTTVVN
ncbi:hypothetical protein [Pseudomonas plecoglossicida]|uniref:hypothetical protein n=1 Tax=Pseudomonas plecoglossicida TaxID=70775 RepID=UPI000AFAB6D0|nr:hypothetical protein [Pseudomonas plecoglossicida]